MNACLYGAILMAMVLLAPLQGALASNLEDTATVQLDIARYSEIYLTGGLDQNGQIVVEVDNWQVGADGQFYGNGSAGFQFRVRSNYDSLAQVNLMRTGPGGQILEPFEGTMYLVQGDLVAPLKQDEMPCTLYTEARGDNLVDEFSIYVEDVPALSPLGKKGPVAWVMLSVYPEP